MKKPEQKELLALARESIKRSLGVDSNEVIDRIAQSLPHDFKQHLGVFVTIKKIEGEERTSLRGCIGNIIGKGPVWESILTLSREAAFHDPRFSPVRLDELHDLIIEISLLTPPKSIDSYRQIRLGEDGVILTLGYNRAVFLPQVATEQGWTREELLDNLCLKAGLYNDSWRDPDCLLEVFQAEVFSEDEV